MASRTDLGLTPAALTPPPHSPVPGDALLTERETRELLKLKPQQLSQALEERLLEGIPAGKQYLITLASALDCLHHPERLNPIWDEELLTPAQVGRRLQVDPRTLADLLDAGYLTPIPADGGPRFRRGDVREVLENPPPQLHPLQRPRKKGQQQGQKAEEPEGRGTADVNKEVVMDTGAPRAEGAGTGTEIGAAATETEPQAATASGSTGHPANDVAAGSTEGPGDGPTAAPAGTGPLYYPPGGGPPFRLDPFQVQAEALLEEGKHVLVSAPTGSGKSLIAERLVEKAQAEGKGLIYTGPIKALINQKYRDLSRLYGAEQVGIITGDVVIRETAPILVMTTEIFRNMAVGHPETLNGYGYLVLDEVHYLDSDRGATWEESIIFAPPHLQILALSATVANAEEIAAWMESTTGRATQVVLESHRPVPLAIHYAGPSSRITDQLDNALDDLARHLSDRRWDGNGKAGGRTNHVQVVQRAARRGWLPCLYFVFSRVGCEERARELSWAEDFLKPTEAQQVEAFLAEAETDLLRSSGSYRLLRSCLVRGVGFHHAGMLPAAKEVVERLYERGLVKVLYCTETFAVGVNFPVRSALFDGARKFDGEGFRPMSALEFHQMAGRAGRRGIDREGHAVLILGAHDREGVRDYAKIRPEPVLSRLELRPNTVLNLVASRSPEEIEAVLTRSLKVFQATRQGHHHQERVEAARRRLAEVEARMCAAPGTMACPAVRQPYEEAARALEEQLAALGPARNPRARRLRRRAEDRLQNLQRQLATADPIPHSPEQVVQCQQHLPEYQRLKKELRRVEKRAQQGLRVVEELKAQFQMWKDRLTDLQFIAGDQLLPRGEFAREIHVAEIALTELYFSGFFHQAREEEICAVIAALAYDGKEQLNTVPRKPSAPVRQALPIISRYAENFNRTLFAPAYEWARGRDFVLLMREYNLAEGDLIGALRRTIDLLRQIKRALGQDPIKEKIGRCMELVDRPPVTVELD